MEQKFINPIISNKYLKLGLINMYNMCDHKRLKINELIEGVDFYWQEMGGVRLRVFTKEWLLMTRLKCCESGCINCPFDFKNKKNNNKYIV